MTDANNHGKFYFMISMNKGSGMKIHFMISMNKGSGMKTLRAVARLP